MHCGTAIWSAWCRFASPPPIRRYLRHTNQHSRIDMARRSTVRCVEEFILFDALYEDETSWRSPPPSCGPDRPPIPVADRNGPPPSGIRSPGCRPRHSVRRGVGGMEKSEEQADASRGRGAERPARSAHPTRSTRRFAGGGYWLLPRPILAVVARRSPLISGIIGGAADVVDSIASPPSGCVGLFLRFLRAPPPPVSRLYGPATAVSCSACLSRADLRRPRTSNGLARCMTI
jgi:hypothetical protein